MSYSQSSVRVGNQITCLLQMMMERKRPKARGRKRRGVGDSFRCVVYDKVVLNASNNPFPAAQYLITCLYMRLGMTDSINLNSHTGDERSHKSNQLLLSGSISPTHPPLPNGTKFTCPTPIPPPGQTHHAHLYLSFCTSIGETPG